MKPNAKSRTVVGRRTALASLVGAASLLAAPRPWAQSFPSKPIRIIVPSTAGVVPDIFSRVIGQRLSEILKTPVLVENRPGAGSSVGATYVSKAEPDGYTLLFGDTAVWGINPHVYSKLPYEPMKDLVPIAQVVVAPVFLTVNATFPATTLKELVAYAKAHPRKINYSTPGIGSSGHLAAEMFSKVAGVEMVHVPFKGADGIQALLSNDVQLAFFGLAAIESHVAAGKLRILSTTTPRRSAALPNIPTLVEAGVPDFEFSSSMGLLAPAGTPAGVIARLNESINQAVADPSVAAKLASFGTLPIANPTPERFGAVMRDENQKLGQLIKTVGLKLE